MSAVGGSHQERGDSVRPDTGYADFIAASIRKKEAEQLAKWQSRTFFVYRLHDENGQTLYIGMSGDLPLRLRGHRSEAKRRADKAEWFYRTRSISLAGPFNYWEATEREREELRIVQPVGNVAHTERDHRPAVAERVAWLNARDAS